VRLLVIMLALSGFVASVAHGRKPRIAVFDLDASGVSRLMARDVSDQLRRKLIETNRFIVPERQAMEDILREQEAGVTLRGCLDETTSTCFVEIGRIVQAEEMIVGTLHKRSVSVRLVDLESTENLFAVDEPWFGTAHLSLALDRLVYRLLKYSPLSGRVSSVRGRDAVFDVGSDDGARPGMLFRIDRVVERVRGFPERDSVGVARVESVQEGFSIASIIGTGARAQEGYLVTDLPVAPAPLRRAYLTIRCNPVPANITIDGLPRAQAGKEAFQVELEPGEHAVGLTPVRGWYDAAERSFDLEPGARETWNVMLTRQTAYLTVASDRPDAEVRIDTVAAGRRSRPSGTRPTGRAVALPPGAYRVQVSKPGYEMATEVVRLGPHQRRTINVPLAPRWGYLVVTSEPVGAQVFVDGELRGDTDEDGLGLQLLAISHEVRVVSDGETRARSVDILVSERNSLFEDFRVKPPEYAAAHGYITIDYSRRSPRRGGTLEANGTQLTAFNGLKIGWGAIRDWYMLEVVLSPIIPEVGRLRGRSVWYIAGSAQFGLCHRFGVFVPYAAVGWEDILSRDFDSEGVFWTLGLLVGDWTVPMAGRFMLHASYRTTWIDEPESPHWRVVYIGVAIAWAKRPD
jgi:hypothetical protein